MKHILIAILLSCGTLFAQKTIDMGGRKVVVCGEQTASYTVPGEHPMEMQYYTGLAGDSLCLTHVIVGDGHPFHLYQKKIAVSDLMLTNETGIEPATADDGKPLFNVYLVSFAALRDPSESPGRQLFYAADGTVETKAVKGIILYFDTYDAAYSFLEQVLQREGLSLSDQPQVKIAGVRVDIAGSKTAEYKSEDFAFVGSGFRDTDYIDFAGDSLVHTRVRRKNGWVFSIDRTSLAIADLRPVGPDDCSEVASEGKTFQTLMLFCEANPVRPYDQKEGTLTKYIGERVSSSRQGATVIVFQTLDDAKTFAERLSAAKKALQK